MLARNAIETSNWASRTQRFIRGVRSWEGPWITSNVSKKLVLMRTAQYINVETDICVWAGAVASRVRHYVHFTLLGQRPPHTNRSWPPCHHPRHHSTINPRNSARVIQDHRTRPKKKYSFISRATVQVLSCSWHVHLFSACGVMHRPNKFREAVSCDKISPSRIRQMSSTRKELNWIRVWPKSMRLP